MAGLAVWLSQGEGGLWRRVIAGQKPACIAGRGTYSATLIRTSTPGRAENVSAALPPLIAIAMFS